MEEKKSVLGRGLENLLGENLGEAKGASPSQDTSGKVLLLPLDRVEPCSAQPRKSFDKAALESLSESIKSHGVLQPIIVRQTQSSNSMGGSAKYEIIAGERRWRAANLAHLKQIPAIVKEADVSTRRKWALLENIQREDLNVIEEARAYEEIVKFHSLSHEELAESLGVNRSTVLNKVRLLKLPRQVQDRILAGELSLGQGKVLLSLDSPKEQLLLAEKAIKQGLSVRALEKCIKGHNKKALEVAASKDSPSVDLALRQLERELESVTGLRVKIAFNKGKGYINMAFNDNETLNRSVLNIKKGWGRTYGL